MAKRNAPQPSGMLSGVVRMREHRILDYFIVVILTMSAVILGFDGIAYFLAFGLAVVHLSMTIMTSFTHDNVIPLKLHATIEVVAAPVLAILSTLPIFEETKESIFFAVSAAIVVLIWLLSDYTEPA